MQKVLATLKNLKSDTERGEEVLDALVEIKDVLSLPLHPSPPGISSGDLKVDLLPHQSQGLLWMLKQEAPKLPTKDEDQPVQLVQYKSRGGGQKAVYLNLASRSPTEEKPTLARGGLVSCFVRFESRRGRRMEADSVPLTACRCYGFVFHLLLFSLGTRVSNADVLRNAPSSRRFGQDASMHRYDCHDS